MKMKHYLTAPVLAGLLLSSCTDDNIKPDNVALETFREMFPDASAVKWERESTYYVAGFKMGSLSKDAWFDGAGEWKLTETELPFADVPEAVRQAFEASEFATWTLDDVDFVERKDRETIYVLEVEKGNTEYDLYYLADGTLVKAFPDDDDDNDYLPTPLPTSVADFIADRYPSYRLVDVDTDDGRIEVELMDGNVDRELTFTADGAWVSTETEVRFADLPENIVTVFNASKYDAYEIDDIEFVETPEGNYYEFELELGNDEVEIRIHENGDLEVLN